MENKFKGTYVEYHIVQSFPVTCLNRDDVGSPKTAVVGGTTRARVSSQCWKRAVRMQMHELGAKLGIRTKDIQKLLEKECVTLGADETAASECAKQISEALSKDTLFFFSENEAKVFAEYAKENDFNLKDKKVASDIGKIAAKTINKAHDCLDIALFGRMVANAANMNIEAAASFAHAISTHRISNEVDFFTALDDFKEEEDKQGAGHMGSLEFNSATYYRYISLNLGVLSENLGGSEDLKDAVATFTKALYLAVPNARQATQSGASPWEYAKILVRKGQRMQVPFDNAVRHENGYAEPSIKAMNEYITKKEKEAASLYGKKAEFTIGDGSLDIDRLINGIKEAIG